MNKTTQIRRNNCNSIVYTSFCYILILCFISSCTTINYHSAFIYLLYIYILNFLSYHFCTVIAKTSNWYSFVLKHIIFSLWENIYVVNFHFISFIYNCIYVRLWNNTCSCIYPYVLTEKKPQFKASTHVSLHKKTTKKYFELQKYSVLIYKVCVEVELLQYEIRSKCRK